MKPNYQKYDPLGWGGDPKRGAAMGRGDIIEVDPHEFEGRVYLSKLRMVDDGAYDNLGTYWGANIYGIGDIYWCALHNAEDGKDIDFVVRAQNRKHAKMLVLRKLPKARFFR